MSKDTADVIIAWSTLILAGGTVLLAIFNAAMAYYTRRLAIESKEASRRQLGVQTWLEMQKRFDSSEITRARKKLVPLMKNYRQSDHRKVSETVLNFFEDVGILFKMGFIDRDLVDSSFSYYATRWYEACKHYIDNERKRHKEDSTLFEHFEFLSTQFRILNPEDIIDSAEMDTFFEDEGKLVTDAGQAS